MAEDTPNDVAFDSWPLVRYARRIASTQDKNADDGPTRRVTRSYSASMSQSAPWTTTTVNDDDQASQWTVYSSSETDKLSLNLTRGQQQLIVFKGNLIMESIFLVKVRKTCKAIAKGDSILFLYKTNSAFQSGCRQFRVKFEAFEGESGAARCQNFVLRTQNLVRFIGELFLQDGTAQSNDQAPTSMDLGEKERTSTDVAQAILSRKQLPLPECYAECAPDVRGLENLIAFCLADPTFPAFVDSVEKCLLHMTSIDGDAESAVKI